MQKDWPEIERRKDANLERQIDRSEELLAEIQVLREREFTRNQSGKVYSWITNILTIASLGAVGWAAAAIIEASERITAIEASRVTVTDLQLLRDSLATLAVKIESVDGRTKEIPKTWFFNMVTENSDRLTRHEKELKDLNERIHAIDKKIKD